MTRNNQILPTYDMRLYSKFRYASFITKGNYSFLIYLALSLVSQISVGIIYSVRNPGKL